jgi:hypothetical protein
VRLIAWLLRVGASSLAVSALAATLYAGSGANQSTPRLIAPSTIDPSLGWEGPQFFRSDRQGNVFLVRGDTLDIYPVIRGQLGKAQHLQAYGNLGDSTSDVAVNSDGSQWAVLASNHILSFKNGKQQATPDLGWAATSVAMLDDRPVAGVVPMGVGRRLTSGYPAVPPLALRLDQGSWATYIEGVAPRRSKQQNPINALFAEHTVRLTPDERGRLWVNFPYAGRVLRFTSAGCPDLEISFGPGTPKYRQDEDSLRKSFEESLLKQGYRFDSEKAGVFTAKIAVHSVTVAPQDRTLYMLLGPGIVPNGTLLARYNSARGSVETVQIGMPSEEEISMAAGRDGLYMAAATGNAGRWWLPWQSLAQGSWREFPMATIHSNGVRVAGSR